MTDVAISFVPIQQESLQADQPTSEASLSAIGGLANGIFSILFPVGTIVDSILTESQWQALTGTPSPELWILADGRSIAGSALANSPGYPLGNFAPNICGIFRRGKNNGRSDGNQNPDGELALGTYTADKFLNHSHSYSNVAVFLTVGNGAGPSPLFPASPANTGSTGANETAPKNITINTFIRIN